MSKKTDNKLEEIGVNVRQRLLDSAERLFAEKGFKSVSVRDITSGAECNLASVNYYFGGKDKLYFEVYRNRLAMLRDIRVDSIKSVMQQKGKDVTLEDLLGVFAEAFIAPLVDYSRGYSVMRLMIREMLDPQVPREMFYEDMVKPIVGALQQAMIKICPQLDRENAIMCIQSFVAQLVHTLCLQQSLAEVDNVELTVFDLAGTVKHIVRFTAAGIDGYAKATKIKD